MSDARVYKRIMQTLRPRHAVPLVTRLENSLPEISSDENDVSLRRDFPAIR